MQQPQVPDCDVTVVLRVCDDEERVGHVVQRLAAELHSLERTFEILVADEGSGDNTLAIAALLRRTVPELEWLHAEPNCGCLRACERARGRAVVIYDVRAGGPLTALGSALGQLAGGVDVIAVNESYFVLRRTRVWRAFEALVQKTHTEIERRFLKRARSLGLHCEPSPAPRKAAWTFLREKLFVRPVRL